MDEQNTRTSLVISVQEDLTDSLSSLCEISRCARRETLAQKSMYIPAWPSLNPAHLLKRRVTQNKPFPVHNGGSTYFYVARNAIYHLMRQLRFGAGDVVLAPDYHHGNEILAMKAAGVKIRYYPIEKDLDVNLGALDRLCQLE